MRSLISPFNHLMQVGAPALLGLLFGLTLVLAVFSAFNVHPDEIHHFKACEYYTSHWLPPRAGSPEVDSSRSIWGTSYLDTWDVFYFFCGKYLSFSSAAFSQTHVAARSFQILLLLSMLVCALWLKLPNELLVFFMLAQGWYVFAYTNGDAFPFFLSFFLLVGFLHIHRKSKEEADWPVWHRHLAYALLGVLLGFLVVSKQNFLASVVGAGFCMSWLLFAEHTSERRKKTMRGLLLAVTCAAVCAGGRIAVDLSVNGLEKSQRILEGRERIAAYECKPSTPPEQSLFSIRLREKGWTISDLFTRRPWTDLTYRSLVGYFGYMNVESPSWYYATMRWILAALVLLICTMVFLYSDRGQWILMLGSFLVFTLLVSASVYVSWTYDYQPQGRYLFPMLGLVGFHIGICPRLRDSLLLRGLLLIGVACSACALLTAALPKLLYPS